MSVEPSSSVTLPSLFSLASTLEVKPMLNQNPEAIAATPLFAWGGFQRRLPLGGVARGLHALDVADACVGWLGKLPVAFLGAVLKAELDWIDVQLAGRFRPQPSRWRTRRG